MSVKRVVGLETEFAVTDPNDPRANVLALCAYVVDAYGRAGQASGGAGLVPWDYRGENPLNDARGFKFDRSEVHPSLLTDDPDRPAPSGEFNAQVDYVRRPSDAERALPKAPNAVLTNGARLYVDHAHPEYSAPEVSSPREAVLWDRAGELIGQEAMELSAKNGHPVVLYKNNVDGKGAAFGTHENYLMRRSVDFRAIIRYLTPFFVTRPLVCGAGRVGIGQRSEQAGFQISQRADYVENDVGIETTFNRPIINTRDEPHADDTKYRRLHVIGGDANQFDASNLLKVGTTSLLLWLLENPDAYEGAKSELERLVLRTPVEDTAKVSHDTSLSAQLDLEASGTSTALDIQKRYFEILQRAYSSFGVRDADTDEVLELWDQVLRGLSSDPDSVADKVEWVAKLGLLERFRQRNSWDWGHDKLKAIDLQWADLRPERSIVARLDRAGAVMRLHSQQAVREAVKFAPESTRAYVRGGLIRRFPRGVAAANWESITVDVEGQTHLVRLAFVDPQDANKLQLGESLETASSVAEFVDQVGALA